MSLGVHAGVKNHTSDCGYIYLGEESHELLSSGSDLSTEQEEEVGITSRQMQ